MRGAATLPGLLAATAAAAPGAWMSVRAIQGKPAPAWLGWVMLFLAVGSIGALSFEMLDAAERGPNVGQ